MKAIQLNKDQQYQLLLMAKRLFPEYYKIEILSGGCDECLPNIVKLVKTINAEPELIHWFEFCAGFLISAILKPKQGYRYHRETLEVWGIYAHNFLTGINNTHPIDFLFEEFKNLHK